MSHYIPDIRIDKDTIPKKYFFMVISAPRGSGKSSLTRSMIKNLFQKEYDYCFLYSPSLDLNDDYSMFNNQNPAKGMIMNKYSDEAKYSTDVQKVIETQIGYTLKDKKDRPDILLVLDDVLESRLLRINSWLSTLSHRGRHMAISVIISLQKIRGIPRTIRLNVDIWVLFRINNYSELEQMILEFIPKHKHKQARELIESVFNEKYKYITINSQQDPKTRVRVGWMDPIMAV